MAMLPDVFKSDEHEKMGDFTPIPEGERCLVQINKSEVKDTKAGDGKRLIIYMKVQEGEYKDKTVLTGLNIVNPNPIAVEIAQKELASICDVCHKPTIRDSQELHGIPFFITVGIEETPGYAPRNIVRKYESAIANKPISNPFDS